jgi:hypothetical protein
VPVQSVQTAKARKAVPARGADYMLLLRVGLTMAFQEFRRALARSSASGLFPGLKSICFSWALVMVAVLPALPCRAAEQSSEYEVKAVLVLNLLRFVDWPPAVFATPDAPIVVGIVGNDPFGSALDQAVAGERVSGHRIIVERYPTVAAIKPCHLLFIGSSNPRLVREAVNSQRGKPVLTVSEMPDFTTRFGGIVRLYTNERNKVRLDVNLAQAKAENLKLSSKLLQVAQITSS